ncbi:hypothetical protein CLOACE_14990 [Clostridium acetireducens DSM 10703]|uniref:Uncharacterized protein n=1 Tax=Clostridium acetireducens DSM 10703 TaxID=1121290 RepID=A0A1E8EY52_9CLOT|nr:hypothetical protein CLOACE_14990 [Clostridium acetireducens DSM 10703]
MKLSNKEEGYVVRQNENFPDRPVVRILGNTYSSSFYEIDLLKNPNIVIESII